MPSSRTSKQVLMAPTRFSGGSSSASRVNPRMSANRMVTGRRSPSTEPGSAAFHMTRTGCRARFAFNNSVLLVVDVGVPADMVALGGVGRIDEVDPSLYPRTEGGIVGVTSREDGQHHSGGRPDCDW